MEPYIYCSRNKIHIINLEKTLVALSKALEYVREASTNPNWRILFVGTKRAAAETIAEHAQRSGMPYINHRWLGGVLTNYKTIRSSVRRLQDLEIKRDNGTFEKLTKKEAQSLNAEHAKLERSLSGIKDMPGLPGALFIVDIDYECIAVNEAHRLGIPIVGVVDTNSNPEEVDYTIPSNDDSIRAIRLYVTAIADACIEGRESAGIPIHQTTQNKMTAAVSVGANERDKPAKSRPKTTRA